MKKSRHLRESTCNVKIGHLKPIVVFGLNEQNPDMLSGQSGVTMVTAVSPVVKVSRQDSGTARVLHLWEMEMVVSELGKSISHV